MTMRNVSQAKAELSVLLAKVEQGEEVVIVRAGGPIARLVPIPAHAAPRQAGACKGKIWFSPDFDEPDLELERLFYEAPIEPSPDTQICPRT
jgi:prevent-host-death family protein